MSTSRTINKLTDRKVTSLKEPGRHSDGGGLYLRITPKGAKAWIFMATIGGRRIEIGLGASSSISLAAVRRIAEKMRDAVAAGADPRAAVAPPETLNAPEGPAVPLFGDWADSYLEGIESGFKNPVHRRQWKTTLRTHAAPLRSKPIDMVNTDDVLEVLRPLWTTRNETASRLRGRIERILDAAAAKGFRDRDKRNPAMWSGHLEHFLPKRPKKSLQKHHGAVAWQEMPNFMGALRDRRQSRSVLALQFTILCASRTGEVIGAVRKEFDLPGKVWTVPADRMKMSIAHEVALSDAALQILEAAGIGKIEPEASVFPLSNMAMLMLMKSELGRTETVHGFRSSFRDWAGEATEPSGTR